MQCAAAAGVAARCKAFDTTYVREYSRAKSAARYARRGKEAACAALCGAAQRYITRRKKRNNACRRNIPHRRYSLVPQHTMAVAKMLTAARRPLKERCAPAAAMRYANAMP